MDIINVVKPFQVTVVSNFIKEHILERNLMNVVNVVKPLQVTAISKDIKKHSPRSSMELNPVIQDIKWY
jgi:KRAB domain-containing zinc finger protein